MESVDDANHETGVEGQVLVVLQNLHIQPKEDAQEVQHENIFYTKCHVEGKTCGLIIDSGGCVNIASQYMVDKLNLSVIPHSRPYTLHCFKENSGVKVNQQVLVSINLGKYSNQVLCDVAPMNASHLLLEDHDNLIENFCMMATIIPLN